ncbi:MAG: glycosyltransferase family 39 protein [Oculatellaceae cyanobacterium Prado106]|jgi:uncharacterized membrane protein|nr:glycosyltransferase family 39 protein [Oculatellaceae cyanobacterium Prado106]
MGFKTRFQAATVGLLAIAIAFGVFFRFTHLDVRLPTHDEVFTALRVSGYTEISLVKDLTSPIRPVNVAYLKKYQTANDHKTLQDSLRGLAQEEPQLTPFYYATVKLWAHMAGSSMASLRHWSAILSLLAFPAMYWLCLELFESHLTASIASALLALSPFYFVYSQDARHYSLWTVCLLLTSAIFVRASRSNNSTWWLLYAVGLATSLYAGLLSGLVAAGHLVYTLVMFSRHSRQRLVNHGTAIALSLLAFTPWIMTLLMNYSKIEKMAGQFGENNTSVFALARSWLRLPGRFLYQFTLPDSASFSERLLQYGATGFGLVIAIYTIFVLSRTTLKEVWLFVVTLIGVTFLGLILQDLTLGGHTATGGMSNTSRYLIPCFLGLILAIAHVLSYQILYSPPWKQRTWSVMMVVLMSTLLFNSLVRWQSPMGVIGKFEINEINAAAFEAINQAKNPLIVSDTSSWDVLYFSQNLKPEVEILTRPFCVICNLNIPKQGFVPDAKQNLAPYRHIFLYPNPSPALIDWAKQQKDFKLNETMLLPNQDVKILSLDRL